ncbi:PREDICTED: translation initiation factor IF-2-like isoform X2 [Nicrophorus vespilloides]|uniref:Translation initiation factor IF-2-like isoform X2 n=1 Tax=Nicrophorus vespilloides TaxID=110193 RepID=A0ABM1MGE0_NICVS|nr:PREDICTED: translation initiation factor IF-2-like isoform X2 [Nicrophorus vespilloides]
MKLLVATVLVIVTMASAESSRYQQNKLSRQSAEPSGPYEPRGWRPEGAAFTLPSRSQPQVSYGPPAQEYGPPQPEPTTTEMPTTTEAETEEIPTEEPLRESERLEDGRKSAKVQEQPADGGRPVYFVLPQSQNYFYAVQQSGPLVANLPTTSARLQALPIRGPQFTVNPFYSAPLIQIYQ